MRTAILSFTLASVVVSAAVAQSPTDGRVGANTYENSYFKFSYTWPSILSPVDSATLNLPRPSPNSGEVLLFSARQGEAQYGVVMIADKLHVPTAHHPNGIQDVADFLNRVERGADPAGKWKLLKETHITNGDGFRIDELDYLLFDEYTSAIVTQVGEFLIAFRCNAKSATDLAEMTKSVIALRHLK
jgi:hypothetical protein